MSAQAELVGVDDGNAKAKAMDGAHGSGDQGDLLRKVISDKDAVVVAAAAAAAAAVNCPDGFTDILGSGDLLRRVISDGKGRETRPEDGQEVEIDLQVSIDGAATPAGCERVKLVLGDNDLGYGLDLILKLMELDEVCAVRTTSRYDDRELPRADAWVEYEIRLVGINDPVLAQDMSEGQRLAAATKKKGRGNELYSRQQFDFAAQAFGRALRYLTDGMAASEASDEINQLKLICLNNLAAVQLKVSGFDLAILSCDRALAIDPKSSKALYRKATGLQGKKEFDGAKECLSALLQAEPGNSSAQKLLASVQKGRAREKAGQKAMAKRMFSALDGSSPDVVAREKEIAELASKEEALAAAKKGPKMGDWELRLWVSLAVVVVTVCLTALWPFYTTMLRAAFDRGADPK